MEIYSNNNRSFKIDRYPATSLSSLKPWNAADEYILSYIEENSLTSPTVIINDRFGFLTLGLQSLRPTILIDYKSQEKAIDRNLKANDIATNHYTFSNILSTTPSNFQLGIVKVPKSMELFSLYLHHLSQSISDNGMVICGFMTKYFTSSILEVANKYFGKVEQSLAWKKSRLLILSEPIRKQNEEITESVPLPDGNSLIQYKGVFSSGKIDMGTRFLLENITLEEEETTILDLACGNGIIAHQLAKQKQDVDLYLMDDFYLAVESAKINLPTASCHFNNELDNFNNNFFDVIVINPPFHFGHETNIEVSLHLFKQTCPCLKSTGRFVIVANKHLNYSTHLRKIYRQVDVTVENKKFQIIECRGAL